MRYWEAFEAQVTAEKAIEECRVHQIEAIAARRSTWNSSDNQDGTLRVVGVTE
ncbi:hypothetical protein [Rhizobium sp. AN80A]|uniref:hypothetical protein n=1 Tax=Rhizobium sp. AN80A TaxID=3040673 RepID=UPI0024B36D21|nr:hypothetical protein [Rhizobium sp. AN80A]